METLGLAIKHFRIRKRWTAGQLSTYSGVSPSQISLLEGGKRGKRSSAATLEKIAKALGVTVDDLLNWRPDEELEYVERAWDKLSGDARARIVDIVRTNVETNSTGGSQGGMANTDERAALRHPENSVG